MQEVPHATFWKFPPKIIPAKNKEESIDSALPKGVLTETK
jgi:hypothetical protein